MIALIMTLLIAAVFLEVFSLGRLSMIGPKAIAKKHVTKAKAKIEEKKTSLGRPIEIIRLKN